jgi:hypothetical protein
VNRLPSAHKSDAWYHGGAPGLRPGDVLEPRPAGDERHYWDDCEVCQARRAGAPLEDDDLDPTMVYVTSSRIYAKLYASGYPRGAVYRVEPEGELVESPDPASTHSRGCARARIVAVLDPLVILRPTDIRRLTRIAQEES